MDKRVNMTENESLELEEMGGGKLEEITPRQDKTSIEVIALTPSPLKRESLTYVPPAQTNKKDSAGFYPAEYPLTNIGAAEDTDSYVYQANFKKLALATKEGYNFVGENPTTVEYIKERFRQIEIAQDQPLGSMLIEILGTLLRYHDCYLIKARSVKASGGKVRQLSKGKSINPVAAYFVASPDTIQQKVGKNNRVVAYKHVMPDGRYKIYPDTDIIHFSVNKKPHFLTATPPWHPVIDDVSALRRIEEHVENLVYQHIHPLYQYKVGTEKAPVEIYEDGLTEIDVVKTKIWRMTVDSMIVTPERHEIKGLGAESRALRAEPFLEYFKKRVITGTGLSQIDFGDGQTMNRASADSMSKIAVGNVKFYQQCLARDFNFRVIQELLLEGSFSFDPLAEENIVRLEFTEIDAEAQIKLQNHYMLLYQNGILTRSEARMLSGWQAMKEEQEEDTHLYKKEIPLLEKQGELQLKQAEAQAEQKAAENAAKAKQQPTNQHGTKTGPTGRKSSVVRDSTLYPYESLIDDLKFINQNNINISALKQRFLMTQTRMRHMFTPLLDKAILEGKGDAVLPFEVGAKLEGIKQRILNNFDKDVSRLFTDIQSDTIAATLSGKRDSLKIEVLKYRVRFIEDTLLQKAKTLSKIEALLSQGYTKAIIKADPNGEDFNIWHNTVIDLNRVFEKEIPPFHPNCKCELEPLGE